MSLSGFQEECSGLQDIARVSQSMLGLEVVVKVSQSLLRFAICCKGGSRPISGLLAVRVAQTCPWFGDGTQSSRVYS